MVRLSPKLAEEKGASLKFEAAAAGGIPVIKALRESMAGNGRASGVRHHERHLQLHPQAAWRPRGLSFADCLKAAQELGYAEADPTFDVRGLRTPRTSWRF